MLLSLMVAFFGGQSDLRAEPQADQTFKDWKLACEEVPDTEKKQCYIFQEVSLRESGQRLVHMAVGYLRGKDAPAAILTLPLGISLPPGLGLQVDEGELKRFPVERCTAKGCVGGLPLDDALVDAMKRGKQARIVLHDSKRRAIGVPVSLSGFTAGFKALQ